MNKKEYKQPTTNSTLFFGSELMSDTSNIPSGGGGDPRPSKSDYRSDDSSWGEF